MPTDRTRLKRPPYSWDRVLWFANAIPNPTNWVSILLGRRKPVPIRQTFGISSVDELRPILDRFRDLLADLVSSSVAAAEHSGIINTINGRAAGVLDRWIWVRGTGRVFPSIRTADDSFEQGLYAQLAMAMSVESFRSIKQCPVCQRFFYAPEQRRTAVCSARCRTKAQKLRVTRYREGHQEEYRAYQRRLMAKRRREGTA
jgi:hypothetical protein